MGRRFLLYIIFSVFFVFFASAKEMLDYEKLAKRPTAELYKKGSYYLKQNYLDTAIGYYIIAAGQYPMNKEKSDKYLCVKAAIEVGRIYFQKGHYPEAFDFFMTALKNCEENGFYELLPEIYNNMGSIYCVWEDHQQGLECYKKGLEYSKAHENEELRKKLLINLVGVYCFLNQIDEAKKYYGLMLPYGQKDSLLSYFCLLDKGIILRKEKKMEDAAIQFGKAAEYARKNQFEALYRSSPYSYLAELYVEEGMNDSALYFFHQALAEHDESIYMQRSLLKGLAEVYKRKGDKLNANYYKMQYLVLSDSLFNQTEFNRIKNTQLVYETEKNYRKISTLNAEKEIRDKQIYAQRKALIAISAGLFVFFVMLILMYWQKRKLNYAYKNLFNRNKEILQSEQEYDTFKQEYEHKLAQVKEQLTRYKDQEPELTEGLPETVAECAVTGETEAARKYSVDKLSPEQKENILLAINKVMQDSGEFCECNFSIERLATLTGINSCYISRVINDTYHKNFRTFINEYRIKEAQRRLMNTKEYGNYTIKAVAESVGYKSHANFVLIFKKITGITPSIYQKMAKEQMG